MNDSLTNIAIQFAEANRQQQRWLRDEVKELRAILWAAAASQPNGELIIDESHLIGHRPEDCEFETRDDRANRAKIIRAVRMRQRVDGGREPVPRARNADPCEKSS